MAEIGAYGPRLSDRLHSHRGGVLIRSLRKSTIALTEIRSDHPRDEISDPIPREDAFLVALQLRDFPAHEYWEDGKPMPVTGLPAGCTTLYDLKRDPSFRTNHPFHSVHFYFPRAALNAICDDAQALRIGDLHYEPGAGVDDPVVRGLASSLLPALERPEEASRIFVDHALMAIGVHVAERYGDMKRPSPYRGGLAPWQERRIRALIDANLDGEIALATLAATCGLSVAQFSRAFRNKFGTTPHRWLLRRRVDAAKALLRDRAKPLAEVALACGFADQSHFTRVFGTIAQISPGAWRRQQLE